MKCKGTWKEKTPSGRTVKRKCNNELSEYAIFCDKCGTPTNALSTKLNAKKNWQEVRETFTNLRGSFYKFNIFFLITVFIPIGAVIFFQKDLAQFIGIDKYLFLNLALLLLVPLSLIPFAFDEENYSQNFSVKNYFRKMKYYPKFFLFTLENIIFFFILKVLCTGYLIGVTVDPILAPVRVILVLHWITIMFPAPLVIVRKNVNPLAALKVCHTASAETRWQQFFTLFYVATANILGLLAVGLGLLRSISFSYLLIENYYNEMNEYRLFEKREN